MKASLKLRSWIWDALCEIVLNHAYSNLYLKEHLQELDGKDQALATQIVYGTLQNYSYCQAVWKQYAKRKVNARIGVLLTFSVYQLLFLDSIPAYAVIDQAVSLAKIKARQLAGFVNAILHKVDKNAVDIPVEPLEKAAFENSLPLWLLELWKEQYGEDKAIEMAEVSRSSHPVFIRWNPLKSDKRGIEEAKGNPARLPEYKEGLFSVQDPGSYEIVRFLNPQKDEVILDCCAAPGTKSFAAAEMMEGTGHIDALDLYEHRSGLIEKDKQRLGLLNVYPGVQDATALKPEAVYDRVLVDVPCSGLGVLARKPDMKLNLKEENLSSLLPVQQQILRSAARTLKPGGTLVYSTCTLNRRENEEQVEAFLRENPEYRLEEEKTLFPSEKSDGFFMARLRRSDEKHL